MTARGWTPGPWHQARNNAGPECIGHIRDSVGLVIARCAVTRPDHEANAARIVSCVNGCAALPDPERDVADLITVLRSLTEGRVNGVVTAQSMARSLLARLESK